MARRKSAYTTLDELRQAAGDERVKQRDVEAQLEAGKAKVESAIRGIAVLMRVKISVRSLRPEARRRRRSPRFVSYSIA
jgi:hypothetical protein